jgi:hypothetical protein
MLKALKRHYSPCKRKGGTKGIPGAVVQFGFAERFVADASPLQPQNFYQNQTAAALRLDVISRSYGSGPDL